MADEKALHLAVMSVHQRAEQREYRKVDLMVHQMVVQKVSCLVEQKVSQRVETKAAHWATRRVPNSAALRVALSGTPKVD